MVDEYLNKKYKLASSENFDEFMKTLGKYKFLLCQISHYFVSFSHLHINFKYFDS